MGRKTKERYSRQKHLLENDVVDTDTDKARRGESFCATKRVSSTFKLHVRSKDSASR